MDFTKHEQTVIQELEKRAGDVLYIQDIAPFFISNSCLQISTFTQTAYIQVGDNMQSALSEYFQLIVFIKKLEQNGVSFSIPFTPLKDNLVKVGNLDFQEYQQNIIADGDLLVQLFQYAGKKYVVSPNVSDQIQANTTNTNRFKANLLIPSILLLLLFLFLGAIGYQSYLDSSKIQLKQEAINSNLEKQTLKIGLLSKQIQNQEKRQMENLTKFRNEIIQMNTSLENHNNSLLNINYWNRKQSKQIEKLSQIFENDSIR